MSGRSRRVGQGCLDRPTAGAVECGLGTLPARQSAGCPTAPYPRRPPSSPPVPTHPFRPSRVAPEALTLLPVKHRANGGTPAVARSVAAASAVGAVPAARVEQRANDGTPAFREADRTRAGAGCLPGFADRAEGVVGRPGFAQGAVQRRRLTPWRLRGSSSGRKTERLPFMGRIAPALALDASVAARVRHGRLVGRLGFAQGGVQCRRMTPERVCGASHGYRRGAPWSFQI
jgi:hypothetical protein